MIWNSPVRCVVLSAMVGFSLLAPVGQTRAGEALANLNNEFREAYSDAAALKLRV